MQRYDLRRAPVWALLVALGCCAAAQAELPFGGAVQVLKQEWDALHPDNIPNPANVFDSANLLLDAVAKGWSDARPGVRQALIDKLGKPGAIMKGQTLYDIVLNVPEQGQLSIEPGNPIELRYMLRGWYLEFTTTQPTAAGKWADPRFSVNFDVQVAVDMPLPGLNHPLSVLAAKASVQNANIDSHGTIADAILDFCGLVKATFGKDYKAWAEDQLDHQQFDFTRQVNQRLAPLNQVIGNLLQQGYQMADAFFNQQAPTLALRYTRSTHVITSGPGIINGVVRWAASDGHVITHHKGAAAAGHPSAHPVDITAKVQTAMAGPMMFTGPSQKVGQVTYHAVVHKDDTYSQAYTITGLPLGVPIMLSCDDAGATWSGNAAGMSRGFPDDGWSGKVILKPGFSLAHLQPLDALSLKRTHHLPVQVRDSMADIDAPAAHARKPGSTVRHRPSEAVREREPELFKLITTNPTGVVSVSGIDFKLVLSRPIR